MVSKPLDPPWTDGSKNLARDLVQNARRTRFQVFGALGHANVAASVPMGGGAYAPRVLDNARVLLHLLRPGLPRLHHFFFAPNPRTHAVASALYAVRRNFRVVHSVVSAPSGSPRYFADAHVAVSRWTAERLQRAGARDVRVIPPGLPDHTPLATGDRAGLGLSTGARLVLFAGDLTEGGGAEAVANAVLRTPDSVLVLACRPKGAGFAAREARLMARLGSRAVSLGTVGDMPRLLASVDVVALPATDLHGKVDLPLVLLEAMQQGRPVVVAGGGPLEELAGDGVAVVEPTPDALAAALVAPPRGDGRARVARDYSAVAMADAYERLYDELG